jgi:hypothetical protein
MTRTKHRVHGGVPIPNPRVVAGLMRLLAVAEGDLFRAESVMKKRKAELQLIEERAALLRRSIDALQEYDSLGMSPEEWLVQALS